MASFARFISSNQFVARFIVIARFCPTPNRFFIRKIISKTTHCLIFLLSCRHYAFESTSAFTLIKSHVNVIGNPWALTSVFGVKILGDTHHISSCFEHKHRSRFDPINKTSRVNIGLDRNAVLSDERPSSEITDRWLSSVVAACLSRQYITPFMFRMPRFLLLEIVRALEGRFTGATVSKVSLSLLWFVVISVFDSIPACDSSTFKYLNFF